MSFVKKIGGALFGKSGKPAQAFRAPGFEQQGELLNQLLTGQAQAAFGLPGGEAFGVPTLPSTFGGVNPQDLMPQFQQATPFQFTPSSFDPNTAVGDIVGAAYKQAQPFLQQDFADKSNEILDIQNRLGTLTSGRTTENLQDLAGKNQLALSNLLGQAAQTQAQQQLGAQQFAAQLDAQRQAQQAEELFRQQGASTAQAQALAQAAYNRAQLGMGAQQQAFAQQQAQLNPLLRLFSLSTGGMPAQPGTSGLFGSALQAGGRALGGYLGGMIPL